MGDSGRGKVTGPIGMKARVFRLEAAAEGIRGLSFRFATPDVDVLSVVANVGMSLSTFPIVPALLSEWESPPKFMWARLYVVNSRCS